MELTRADRDTFIWLLESSVSDYAMGTFATEELALEALEAVRVRLVNRWKDEVTEIHNGAFMVRDDLYTIMRSKLHET